MILLVLKVLCGEVLTDLDKHLKSCNNKSIHSENNMVYTYSAKSKKIFPHSKHISTHIIYLEIIYMANIPILMVA